MRLESLIRCHQNAFAYFGGWPAKILYDNMRQVIVRPGLVNPRFRDFADHHGFEPKAHRPYRPRTKGKVERMVSYVKDNFLAGRSFDSLEALNTQGRNWLDTTARNVRIHATTGCSASRSAGKGTSAPDPAGRCRSLSDHSLRAAHRGCRGSRAL